MWDMKNPVGNIKNNTVDEIANSDKLNLIRKNMIAGVYNSNCIECNVKDTSDTNEISHKVMQNKVFEEIIPELIQNTNTNGSIKTPFKMRYMNIRYSNLCNMSCRTCGSFSSSLWAQEQKFPIPVVKITDSNPRYLEEIFERLPEVEYINFAGGESILIPEHWLVLDKLIELSKFDAKIRYVTNISKLTYQNKNILDYAKKFNNFMMMGSIDASHARGEVYRNGTHWPTIEKNLKEIRESDIDFKVNCTIGAMNIWHAPDLQKYLIENNLIRKDKFSINMLIQSEMQSAKILPLHFKTTVDEKIQKHKEWLQTQGIDASQWNIAVKFMFSQDHSHLLDNFISYNIRLDKIRNQNTFATFPELLPLTIKKNSTL
jgi:sulfatase maturation enzyme AslB (radical SAM superfamily)